MEGGKGSMAVRALVVTALLGGLEIAAAKDAPPPSGLTARQIIERIQDHTGGHDREPWQGPTVDTIKAGDPDTPITGIATTFTATMDVLERAASRKTNLVIAHEPTFYNHLDETAWLGDDPVLQAKLAYVKEHHLVIWRFHDHLHRAPGQPDRILKGTVAALGWSAFPRRRSRIWPGRSSDGWASAPCGWWAIRACRSPRSRSCPAPPAERDR